MFFNLFSWVFNYANIKYYSTKIIFTIILYCYTKFLVMLVSKGALVAFFLSRTKFTIS